MALWKRIALVVFGLIVSLVVLEVGARAWFSWRGTERERILYLYDRDTIASKTTQLVGVPYLNYSLNPAWEDINPRGIRGDLVAIPKPDGVFRIVALGGSTTFGHALAADETWPAQLQRLLREQNPQVEVVNLGAPGYYSLDSVVNLATHGLPHEPDMVIVYHGINDAIIRMFQDTECYSGDTPLYGFGMDRGIWQYEADALPPSALYRVLAVALGWMGDPANISGRMRHTGLCPPEPQNISPLDNLLQHPPTVFARNMRSIAGLAQAAGAEVVFSTFAWDVAAAENALAENPELYQTQAMLTGIVDQNAVLQNIADKQGALLVDLAAEMDADTGPYFQGDQVHQTVEGAYRQAEVYAAFIQAQDLVPR